MKIYFIYRTYDELSPTLYAIADTKEKIKEFKSTRNMDVFVVKEKELNKKELAKITSEANTLFLNKYKLTTKKDGYKTFINVYLTHVEYMLLEHAKENIYEELFKIIRDYRNYILSCNDEIIDELSNLLFFDALTSHTVMHLDRCCTKRYTLDEISIMSKILKSVFIKNE